MNPYQPGEDNQDPYEVGYKAGAASRDAEVAKLKDDNEYLYVAAIERDQLREQVKMLRDALKRFLSYGNVFAYRKSDTNPYTQAEEALAATEQK